jgi:hypothetical protein
VGSLLLFTPTTSKNKKNDNERTSKKTASRPIDAWVAVRRKDRPVTTTPLKVEKMFTSN